MKFVLVVLISLISFTTAQDFVAGKVKSTGERSGRAAALNANEVCAKVTGVQSYCYIPGSCEGGAVLFVCNVADEPLNSTCPTTKPYCVGDAGKQACSATPGPFCPKSNSICKSPGYYPEPSDCNTYHYCYSDPNNGIQSITYQCPVGAPFNPSGPQDRKCQINGKCVSNNCTKGLTEEWRALNYDNYTTNRIAAKCAAGNVAYVHICPAGLSLDLNTTSTEVCTIKCLTNYQKAVYPGDETMYYVCLLGKEYLRRCEFGQKFDGDKMECVQSP